MKIQITPTIKQLEVWRYLRDRKSRWILYSGSAGGGKSWLISDWLFFMAMTYPGTSYFIGRSQLKLLRESFLPTFLKVVRSKGLQADSLFKINVMDSKITFHNGSTITMLDLQHRPGDENYDSLMSTEYSCGAIEELSDGIPYQAFDTLKSRIGRNRNEEYGIFPKILMTTNAYHGWAYSEVFKRWEANELPDDYAFIHGTVEDNPYLRNTEYHRSLESITDHSRRQRLLLGDWNYAQNDGSLLDLQSILDAFGPAVSGVVPTGAKYLSVDVARTGEDKSCLIVLNGLRVERILLYEKLLSTQLIQKILEVKNEYDIPVSNICLDASGLGQGYVDHIPGAKQFISSSRPLDESGPVNFSNLRTQCFYRLCNLIKERKIYIGVDSPTMKNMIIEELLQTRLKNPDGDGKMQMIAKDEIKRNIGRSPDVADALAMAMIFLLQPQGYTQFGGCFRPGHGQIQQKPKLRDWEREREERKQQEQYNSRMNNLIR